MLPGTKKFGVSPTPDLTLEDLALAVDLMGGIRGLVKFARRNAANERLFWSVIFPKLLPLLEKENGDEMRTALVAATRWLPEH